MSIKITDTVCLMDSELFLLLGDKAILVLSYIEPKLTDEWVTITRTELYKAFPFSERTVQDCLYKLRDFELIDVNSRHGYSNEYRRGRVLTNLYSRRSLKG